MSSIYLTQQSALAKYTAISPKLFQVVINCYEANEHLFLSLERKTFFSVKIKYLNALFEQGDYGQIVNEVDELIEISIQENIYASDGIDDVYSSLLFKKAVSLFHVNYLDESLKILKSLIRMNGAHDSYSFLIQKCCTQKYKPLLMKTRAYFIGFLLLTAFLICLELLLVKSFYPDFLSTMQIIRNSVFGIAIGLLVIPEATCQLIAYFKANKFKKEKEKE